MRRRSAPLLLTLCLLAALFGMTAWTAHAGSSTDFSALQLNGTAALDGTQLFLTDGLRSEAGSAYTTQQIDVTHFSTSFTFQIDYGNSYLADGIAFTLQADSPTALGGTGGDLGYAGIDHSLAIYFSAYHQNTGVVTHGVPPYAFYDPWTGFSGSYFYNLGELDYSVYNVTIAYDGTTLTYTISDLYGDTDSYTYGSPDQPLNIPALIGSSNAYVGFSGATGDGSAAFSVSNWQYSSTPTIATPGNITATATSAQGAIVPFTATASDSNGPVDVTCSPASGSQFPLGVTTVTCTAQNAAGFTATATFTVTVTYSWSGVLQPLNADGSSVSKAGSTIPVKFQLTGASAGVANAVARLTYSKVGSGTFYPAVSSGASNSGNLFRYDPTSGQYIFNWNTKGLSAGAYQLSIDLGDGVTRTVNLTLK